MSRWQAFLCLFVIWAGIFLPALGTTEIKGEEGRRIMPAITMLETGQWIVPQMTGRSYLRKPPLINWAIAGSMKVLDRRDEWAARLPSVLSVLALGAVTLFAAASWLRPSGALIAALAAISSVVMIEKGRLAEIEAIYVSLSGIAMVWWICCWRMERSPWINWTVCGVFLGLAMLTKGPLHLLFFYAVVIGILWRARNLSSLLSFAHLAGLVICAGIFAAWAVPYFSMTASGEAATTWRGQLVSRITENQFDLKSWLVSIPLGLGNFLPWLLLTPLWWARSTETSLPPRDLAVLRGGRFAVSVTLIGLLLIPGVLPRYTLPLFAPAGLLTGLALRDQVPAWILTGWRRVIVLFACVFLLAGIAAPFLGENVFWSLMAGLLVIAIAAVVLFRRRDLNSSVSLGVALGALMGAAMIFFSVAVVPRMTLEDDVRPRGREITGAIPAGATLYAVNASYQPELFYVDRKIVYVEDFGDLPADARWMLVFAKAEKKALHEVPGAVRRLRVDTKFRKPLDVFEIFAP